MDQPAATIEEKHAKEIAGKNVWKDIRFLTWLLSVIAFVCYYPAAWATMNSRTLVFFVGNPNNAYPYTPTDTVPMWALAIAGCGVGAIIIATECLTKARYLPQVKRLTEVLRNVLVWILAFTEAGLWAMLTAMWMKYFTGEYRPDYTSRLLTYPGGSNPHAIEEGHLSFPSAHAVACFYLATFLCFYLWWQFFMRDQKYFRGRLSQKGDGFWGYIVQELHFALRFLIPLSFFILASMGSISRYISYQHFLWDIIAGALIGLFFATIITLRTIYWYFPTPQVEMEISIQPEIPQRRPNIEEPFDEYHEKSIPSADALIVKPRHLSG